MLQWKEEQLKDHSKKLRTFSWEIPEVITSVTNKINKFVAVAKA